MWKWIKVPKALALLALFLPWMTVSCSGTPLATATGVGLALGKFTPAAGAQNAGPSGGGEISVWLILAIALIVVGLAISFAKPAKNLALAVAATSAAALILIWLGTSKYSKSAMLAEMSKKNGNSGPLDPTAASVIQIDWHFGFWLTLAALAAAGLMAWLSYSGKDGAVMSRFGSAAAPPSSESESG